MEKIAGNLRVWIRRARHALKDPEFVVPVAYVGGIATVAGGVGLVHLAAGVITGGVLAVASVLVYAARPRA